MSVRTYSLDDLMISTGRLLKYARHVEFLQNFDSIFNLIRDFPLYGARILFSLEVVKRKRSSKICYAVVWHSEHAKYSYLAWCNYKKKHAWNVNGRLEFRDRSFQRY